MNSDVTEYKLGKGELLKGFFLPQSFSLAEIAFSFTMISIVVFFGTTILSGIFGGADALSYAAAPMGIAFLLSFFLLPMIFSCINDGWTLKGDCFEIESFGTYRVKIPSMEIALISRNSEWQPSWRLEGVATPGFAVGSYRLKNKKDAIVFKHRNNKLSLLIADGGKFYVIIHPGVEKLHDELIRLGAKEKCFEASI